MDGCFSHIHWCQAVPMVKVGRSRLVHTCPAHHSQSGYHEVPLGCSRVGQIFLRFFAATQNRAQKLDIFKETPCRLQSPHCRWRHCKIRTILPGIDLRDPLSRLGYCYQRLIFSLVLSLPFTLWFSQFPKLPMARLDPVLHTDV